MKRRTDINGSRSDEGEPSLVDDAFLCRKWSLLSPRILAQMRRRKVISYYPLGHRTIRYPWPDAQVEIDRFMVRAVGSEKK